MAMLAASVARPSVYVVQDSRLAVDWSIFQGKTEIVIHGWTLFCIETNNIYNGVALNRPFSHLIPRFLPDREQIAERQMETIAGR